MSGWTVRQPSWLDGSLQRMQTMHAVNRCLRRYGAYHVATFAAIARAHYAWEGLVRPPRFDAQPHAADLAHAYTTADIRAHGGAGWSNRHQRKHARRREAIRRAEERMRSYTTAGPVVVGSLRVATPGGSITIPIGGAGT